MLHEIICNEFKQKRVEFHPSLNTILGDDIGSNSIGKSTFLMIIDFVFGGKDYIMKSTDIQRNVGNHTIKFCFIFEKIEYYFLRNTDELEVVSICNEKYEVVNNLPLSEYCDLLKKKYKIELVNISFRNIVSRYSRIYGKENLNEKRPLHVVHNESAVSSINELLKLFDLYGVISELELLLKNETQKLKTFRDAQKFEFVSSIGKRLYKKNLSEIETLYYEKENISKDLDNNLLDLDSVKAEEVIKLKQRLSIAKRQRSRLSSQLDVINNNIKYSSGLKPKDFEELLVFFPNANIRSVVEIERFHHELKNILRSELIEKKNDLNVLISISQSEINEIENKIKEIINTPNLTTS